MVLGLVGGGLDAWANICPGTIVEGLLLTPEDISIRVLVEMGCKLKLFLGQK